MKGEKHYITVPLGVGISSLVAIFVVLTLVILGVLALQTAYTERQMVNKQISYMQEYYAADNQGEEIVKEIHQLISSAHYHTVMNQINNNKVLRNYERLTVQDTNHFSISYKLHLKENQYLHIIIKITHTPFAKEKITYQTVEWKVIIAVEEMNWKM